MKLRLAAMVAATVLTSAPGLACLSHYPTAEARDTTARTSLRLLAVLNVLSSTPARAKRLAPSPDGPLAHFASPRGEKGRSGETAPSMEAVKREIHLEKRARLAIRYARATVSRVEALYREGNSNEGAALLLEIQEAVELANESLQATGKPAWKKSKPFKVVEIATRKLLRDLDDLDKKLSFNERDQLLAVRTHIEQLNQKLLMAIMTKKRKN